VLELLRQLCGADPRIGRERVYESQQVIITEGEKDRRMFVVLSGGVRVVERVALDDDKHIQPGLCDLSPGDIFGELTLFESARRSATVISVDKSVLLEIDTVVLEQVLDEDSDLGYRLLKHLFQIQATRLRKADQRFGTLLAWGLKAHAIDQHL
jgi:CRP-like cAMP-binding protein